jgi:hypothetical protein
MVEGSGLKAGGERGTPNEERVTVQKAALSTGTFITTPMKNRLLTGGLAVADFAGQKRRAACHFVHRNCFGFAGAERLAVTDGSRIITD